eukprot:Sspe_Gene.20316::Locus_7447_Transcript_2_2_Confidence_0.750_Length_1875::g.20316::m.20316
MIYRKSLTRWGPKAGGGGAPQADSACRCEAVLLHQSPEGQDCLLLGNCSLDSVCPREVRVSARAPLAPKPFECPFELVYPVVLCMRSSPAVAMGRCATDPGKGGGCGGDHAEVTCASSCSIVCPRS